MANKREANTSQFRTFSDFLRAMRSVCQPKGVSIPKFEKACELMWFDGLLNASELGRIVDMTRQTTHRYVVQAKALGLQEGHFQPRGPKQDDSVEETLKNTRRMTTAERRERYVALLDTLLEENRDNPQAIAPLIDRLTSLIPGLKAPETRLDVQLTIGRGAEDRIFSDLKDNLAFAFKEEPNAARDLIEAVGADTLRNLLLTEVIEDATVDAADSPDEPEKP